MTTTTTTYTEPGDLLPNGAVVVRSATYSPRDGIAAVLAVWRGEFVVWTLNVANGDTVNGVYCRHLDEAMTVFTMRAGIA